MQALLKSAMELHQRGKLDSAAVLYRQVLTQEEDADALHLLGVLHHQKGEHKEAVELICKALALRPSVPAFHANLAEVYRALGQFGRAAGCCRAALRLWPDYPEAHCNLGMVLQGLGELDEAIAHFQEALRLRPGFAAAANNLGNLLREQGHLDEALEYFQKAVAADPAYAPSRTNLGQLLIDRGRPDEALPHCQEAARLQPDTAAMHHNLGNALRELGRLVEARAAYLEALRLEPNLARSHAHLGLVLQEEGRFDDALTWLKQAVELEPENAGLWEFMAELYAEREESAEAVASWERVLALEPGRATAHIGMGWALQDEWRTAEAADHFRAALKINPSSAVARLNLGGIHEEQGEMAEAEAAFREALRLQPEYALPHARLAALLRGQLPLPDQNALVERLKDARLGDGPRARLLFGLAHALDARGEFAEAAQCLRQANALTLKRNKGRREYLPADHEQFVGSLMSAFGPDFFKSVIGWGSDSRRLVFVFGLPRSGTTLIEQVLASHSRIHGAGELRLVRQSFERIPALLEIPGLPLECISRLNSLALHRLAQEHEEKLRQSDDRADRIVDKMPDNYLYLGLIAAMFPNAVLIHCQRDLRDVAVSCWMTDFKHIRWANEPEHIASRFRQYRRVMEHWRAVLPSPIHDVPYEEAVVDLESVARRLIAACGLEWEPSCLDFHRTNRPIRTASVTQVRQPLYHRSVARWKNYQDELAPLFALLPDH